MAGLSGRPVLCTETMNVLEQQIPLTRHGLDGKCWGLDIFPKYSEERARQASRWSHLPEAGGPVPKTKPRHDPLCVGAGVATLETNCHVCPVHHKPICWGCFENGLKLKECCKAHHNESDGAPVKMCREHRMTKCGTCRSVKKCCGYRHHTCKDHEQPTCESCLKNFPLEERRPWQCCKRGHHDGLPVGSVTTTLAMHSPCRGDVITQWRCVTAPAKLASGPSVSVPVQRRPSGNKLKRRVHGCDVAVSTSSASSRGSASSQTDAGSAEESLVKGSSAEHSEGAPLTRQPQKHADVRARR